jgi:aspartate/methionine/tyrosine aminotransferase
METFLAAKEQICICNSVVGEEIAYQYLQRKDELFLPDMKTIKSNFKILQNFMANQEVLEWVEPKAGALV